MSFNEGVKYPRPEDLALPNIRDEWNKMRASVEAQEKVLSILRKMRITTKQLIFRTPIFK